MTNLPPQISQRTITFLEPTGVARLAASGVTILAPGAVWISSPVEIKPGAQLHPNVVIECDATSSVRIASGVVLHSGTHIIASNGGSVVIGAATVLGPGGCTLVADNSSLIIGAHGRFQMALVLAPGRIGDGCQVLGPIEARSCDLAGGQPGDSPNVAARGAVLKGAGRASGIALRTGEVVNGSGDFRTAPIEQQTTYHPPMK